MALYSPPACLLYRARGSVIQGIASDTPQIRGRVVQYVFITLDNRLMSEQGSGSYIVIVPQQRHGTS